MIINCDGRTIRDSVIKLSLLSTHPMKLKIMIFINTSHYISKLLYSFFFFFSSTPPNLILLHFSVDLLVNEPVPHLSPAPLLVVNPHHAPAPCSPLAQYLFHFLRNSNLPKYFKKFLSTFEQKVKY